MLNFFLILVFSVTQQIHSVSEILYNDLTKLSRVTVDTFSPQDSHLTPPSCP